jgi:hypothetical protein
VNSTNYRHTEDDQVENGDCVRGELCPTAAEGEAIFCCGHGRGGGNEGDAALAGGHLVDRRRHFPPPSISPSSKFELVADEEALSARSFDGLFSGGANFRPIEEKGDGHSRLPIYAHRREGTMIDIAYRSVLASSCGNS